MLPVVSGCAASTDDGEGDFEVEEDVGQTESALGAARHKVKADVDLGGGVFVANKPGGFYMGRLLPGQSFDRQGAWYLSHENGTNYAWGMALGNSDVCAWIGPSRGKSDWTAGRWATAGNANHAGRCTDAQKAWLKAGDAKNIASHFNCPPPTASAHGTEKKLLADAPFYWNVSWTGGAMGYEGGELKDFVAKIPKGTSVWYRYTTRDGKRIVAFIPTIGWGFFPAGAVNRDHTGTWSKPGGPPQRC